MKKLKNKIHALCFLGIACLCAVTSKAQFIVVNPPSVQESYVFTDNVAWMNDANFSGGSGELYAVTWYDGAGSKPQIALYDNVGDPVLQFQVQGLAGSPTYLNCNPDIAIAGDINNYYVAVIYKANNGTRDDIYLEVYVVTNMGSGTISKSLSCGNVYNLTGYGPTAATVGTPHIDMINFPDANNDEAAYTFVAAWEDYNCSVSGNPGAKACYGDIAHIVNTCGLASVNLSSCVNPTGGMAACSATQVDIAGYRRPGTGNKAIFTYYDPASTKLYIANWILGAGSPGGPFQIDIGTIEYPRVDALDPPLVSVNTDYDVVYRYQNAGNWDVMQYNNNYGPENTTAPYNDGITGTGLFDNTAPAVTCAVPTMTSTCFSLAYANQSIDSVFIQNVDWFSGAVTNNTGDPYYYEINYNPTIDGPVAISNSWVYDPYVYSDIIPKRTLTCWLNNGDIVCKVAGDPTVYKPAGTRQVNEDVNAKVYPIPATGRLIIEQGEKKQASSYTLMALNGKVLLQGRLDAVKNELKLDGLVKGSYLLQVNYNDKSRESRQIIIK